MDLLLPKLGLILWNIAGLVHLVLVIISIILLVQNNKLDSKYKLFFCFIIFFLPILGSILFLTSSKKYTSVSTNTNFRSK